MRCAARGNDVPTSWADPAAAIDPPTTATDPSSMMGRRLSSVTTYAPSTIRSAMVGTPTLIRVTPSLAPFVM